MENMYINLIKNYLIVCIEELFLIDINPQIISNAPPIIIKILLIESEINERVINFNPRFRKYNPKIKFNKNQSIPKLFFLYCPLFFIY